MEGTASDLSLTPITTMEGTASDLSLTPITTMEVPPPAPSPLPSPAYVVQKLLMSVPLTRAVLLVVRS
jgi:hypothetical protein